MIILQAIISIYINDFSSPHNTMMIRLSDAYVNQVRCTYFQSCDLINLFTRTQCFCILSLTVWSSMCNFIPVLTPISGVALHLKAYPVSNLNPWSRVKRNPIQIHGLGDVMKCAILRLKCTYFCLTAMPFDKEKKHLRIFNSSLGLCMSQIFFPPKNTCWL